MKKMMMMTFIDCSRYPRKFTEMTVGRVQTRTGAEVSCGSDTVHKVRRGTTNMCKTHTIVQTFQKILRQSYNLQCNEINYRKY